ncbi:MAG: prealbumin-like fold domain-containing protein [Gemmatimonadetes bacterium]|nr:prealbumin-like fold domain-containing protein [Gemmatimonadota bacterium]
MVKCDIHGWMSGVLAVFDHPFFAVTGDDGTFSLDGLPPGDYVVEAWHEILGTQVHTVSVTADGMSEIAVAFDSM